jgi:hypothetical protein
MKTVIAASVATLAFPCLSLAEEGSNTPQAPIRHEAPIGHRQPTAAGVQRAQAEKGVTGTSVTPAKSSNIDRRLIICRGC